MCKYVCICWGLSKLWKLSTRSATQLLISYKIISYITSLVPLSTVWIQIHTHVQRTWRYVTQNIKIKKPKKQKKTLKYSKHVAHSTIQLSLLNTAWRTHNSKATEQQHQKRPNKIDEQQAQPWDVILTSSTKRGKTPKIRVIKLPKTHRAFAVNVITPIPRNQEEGTRARLRWEYLFDL